MCFVPAKNVHDIGQILGFFFEWFRIYQFVPVRFYLPPAHRCRILPGAVILREYLQSEEHEN
jgi:hypothetical protein